MTKLSSIDRIKDGYVVLELQKQTVFDKGIKLMNTGNSVQSKVLQVWDEEHCWLKVGEVVLTPPFRSQNYQLGDKEVAILHEDEILVVLN